MGLRGRLGGFGMGDFGRVGGGFEALAWAGSDLFGAGSVGGVGARVSDAVGAGSVGGVGAEASDALGADSGVGVGAGVSDALAVGWVVGVGAGFRWCWGWIEGRCGGGAPPPSTWGPAVSGARGGRMNGGLRVAELLKAHGVPVLFTLIGGHISPILVGAKAVGIRVIDVRHEVNAVFAADAVARLTGLPGVAAVTAGPGVTNAITALKNAQMAQSPVVLLGGATATLLRGRGSLQDIDQMALVRPHVKFAARPDRLADLWPALEEALTTCRTGVPGPCFVELAVDLLYDEPIVREWTKNKTDRPNPRLKDRVVSWYINRHLSGLFGGADVPMPTPTPIPPAPASAGEVRKAAAWLRGAKRPVAIVGSGAMNHPGEATALASAVTALGVPTFLSGMARGLLGADSATQMRHKRSAALKEADVVLLAGVPVDFRLDYGSPLSRAKVISVHLDRTDLVKNRRPDLGILADPHRFLLALAKEVGTSAASTDWMGTCAQRDAARDAEIAKMESEPTEYLHPLTLCRAIDRHLTPNSLLVGDGGDFVATASYVVRPRGPFSWLDPGVFGTLGVGAGFALGAKFVHPESDVWLLWGDGAAGFSLVEMDTAKRHGLPFVAVVGNDGGWTQIARDQVPMLGDDVACWLERNDYHTVAEGLGGWGTRIQGDVGLDDALGNALAASRAGRPALVNAWIGRSEFRKGSISM